MERSRVSLGKDVTFTEMAAIIARAKVAMGNKDPKKVMEEIRQLTPWALVVEYHRAVATLDSVGALTRHEQAQLREYAAEFLRSA